MSLADENEERLNKMSEARKHRRPVRMGGSHLAAGSVLLSALLLSGCSSVPDYANPLQWYRDTASWISGTDKDNDPEVTKGDYPKLGDDKRPQAQTSRDRKDLSNGLAADRSNAKYTQEALKREGNPTRPLNPDVAVAKANPPATVVQQAPVSAADAAPPPPYQASAAPQGVNAQVAAPVPAPVAVSSAPDAPPPPPALNQQIAATQQQLQQKAPPQSVEDAYRRRLAEWNGTAPVTQVSSYTPSPAVSAPAGAYPAPQLIRPGSGTAVASLGGAQPIHLIPPSEYRRRAQQAQGHGQSRSGFHDLNEFSANSSASFEVGAVSFGEGTTELTNQGRAQLRDVVRLYKENGGVLRVFGRSASPRLDVTPSANAEANRQLAQQRADAIARELVRLGVPARKLYAGAADDAGFDQTASAESSQIYLDY